MGGRDEGGEGKVSYCLNGGNEEHGRHLEVVKLILSIVSIKRSRSIVFWCSPAWS